MELDWTGLFALLALGLMGFGLWRELPWLTGLGAIIVILYLLNVLGLTIPLDLTVAGVPLWFFGAVIGFIVIFTTRQRRDIQAIGFVLIAWMILHVMRILPLLSGS